MQRAALRATVGGVAVDIPIGVWTAGQNLRYDGTQIITVAGGGAGDVVGPGSATDNAVARFDLTTGKLIQNSAVTIADTTGHITQPAGGQLNGIDITTHAARHNPAGADPMFAGTWAANDEAQWNGTIWVPKLRKTLEVTTNFTGAGTGLTDITGLTVSLPRAGTYSFWFSLATSLATSAQLIAAGINVSANFTRCAAQVTNSTTATAATTGCQVANNTATASASRATLATNLPVYVDGAVTVSGAATLACRIRRAANTLTVAAGSGGFVAEL